MKKGLKQIENDVVFINPETGEAECTYNSCASNFTIKGEEEKFLDVYWSEGNKVPYTSYYRKCNVCGRQVSSDTDKRKTKNNREMASAHSYHILLDERLKKASKSEESSVE